MGLIDRMNFRALDSNFNPTTVIDAYDSIIWSENYQAVGDFEIHGGLNAQLRSIAENSGYIFNTATSSLMVIERHEFDYSDEGNTATISGRSMLSVLDRRVMLETKTITAGTRISTLIHDLITGAFSNPADTLRYWEKLTVVDETPENWGILTEAQSFTLNMGDRLLDIITNLCALYDFGIKCEFVFSDTTRNLSKAHIFTIYQGANRSTPGTKFVIFSDFYDNLITSKEILSKEGNKNAALVIGNATDPVTNIPLFSQIVTNGSLTGLERREMFFNSQESDMVYNPPNPECPRPSDEYIAALQKDGLDELKKTQYSVLAEYEGEILETQDLQYGTNFYLGDVVAFRLPHHSTSFLSRLDGITLSDDSKEGRTLVPHFIYNVPAPTNR